MILGITLESPRCLLGPRRRPAVARICLGLNRMNCRALKAPRIALKKSTNRANAKPSQPSMPPNSSLEPLDDTTPAARSNIKPGRPALKPSQPATTTTLPNPDFAPKPVLEPPTWPSAAARQALINGVPVDRAEGLHLPVRGTLPPWLHGTLFRNGPGAFHGAHAVFDGPAMIVKFEVNGGEQQSVVASHRFLETTYLAAARAAGGATRWTLGQLPGASRTPLGRLQYALSLGAGALAHGFHLGDNALVSVYPSGASQELVAHTETFSGTFRIDPATLATLGRVEFGRGDGVTGMGCTAHPCNLPNGDVLNLASDFMPVGNYEKRLLNLRPPRLTLYRHAGGNSGRREPLAYIPYLRPSTPTWIHQIAVSEHYAVVVQNPCFYDMPKMMFGENGEFLVFKWRPAAGSLIHVVPLNAPSVKERMACMKSFRAPAFLATHWANAYESSDGRHLHLDGCIAEDPEIMAHWGLENVARGPAGGKQIAAEALRRLTIDSHAPEGTALGAAGSPLLQLLVPDAACGHAFDLPAINPAVAGRHHRFVYAACARRPSNCWNAIAKCDVQTGEVRIWHEPGGAAWEPVFCPRPGATAEDDGVVLSVVTQADGRAALLVLDGREFPKELALAVMPYGLPQGFHACWVAEELHRGGQPS